MGQFNMQPIKIPNLPKATFSPEHGNVLGEVFWNVCELYGFSRKQKAALLGLPLTNRIDDLAKEKRLPFDRDKFARAGQVAGIHSNLRMLFPDNREVAYAWMQTPQDDFGGVSPVDWIMQEEVDSYARLFTVRRHLDEMRCR